MSKTYKVYQLFNVTGTRSVKKENLKLLDINSSEGINHIGNNGLLGKVLKGSMGYLPNESQTITINQDCKKQSRYWGSIYYTEGLIAKLRLKCGKLDKGQLESIVTQLNQQLEEVEEDNVLLLKDIRELVIKIII